MRAPYSIIPVALIVSSCFNKPIVSQGKVMARSGLPQLTATVTDGKTVAVYDPNASGDTAIPTPTGALSGAAVTVPPGALSVAAEIVVEESVHLSETSMTASLAFSSDTVVTPIGSGMIIRPTTDVALDKPLTISLPINPTAGLRAWLATSFGLNASRSYTVLYKSMVNGELVAGAMRSSDLRFSDDGSKVVFDGYFGSYWLAEVNAPIVEKIAVKTTEPIVNMQKSVVMTSAGVVNETDVVAKATLPTVEWTAIKLSYDANQRSVSVAASIASGRSVNSCALDLFDKTDASSGIRVETGSSLNAAYAIVRTDAHSLYARFRCIDDQSRLTVSAWSSAVSVPALPAATSPVVASTVSTTASTATAPTTAPSGTTVATSSPSGGITIAGGATFTKTMDVTLSFSASSSVSSMYITNTAGCTSGGTWESFADSKIWTLAASESSNTVYAKFRDSAGQESSCTSASIMHDSIAPGSASITINSGSAYTSSATVTLNLASTGASEMYITNDPSCAIGGSWEAASSIKSGWLLTQNNSMATVYAKFRDTAGNESSCVSSSITHDSVVPTASLSINGGALYTTSTSPLTLNLSNPLSDAASMLISNDSMCSTGTWETFAATKSWSVTPPGTTTAIAVYAKFQDLAGNISSCVSDTIEFRQSYPLTVAVSGLVAGSTLVLKNGTDSLTINNNGTYQFMTLVPENDAYAVVEWTRPQGQNCFIPNLSGNMVSGGATVAVNCRTSITQLKSGAASTSTWGNSIAVDADGSYYISGHTTGSLDSQSFHGNQDAFISKFDKDHHWVWTQQIGSSMGPTNGFGLAVDSSNNVIAVGSTQVGLDYNNLIGASDIFVTKYDSAGNWRWTKQIGLSTKNAQATSVAIDGSDNIIIVGYTDGSLYSTITGSSDFFVSKLDSNGNPLWNTQLDVSAATQAKSVAISPSNDIYVAGDTTGNLDGQIKPGSGPKAGFVTKYDALGNKQWTRLIGGSTATVTMSAIAVEQSGNSISIAGTTTGALGGNTAVGNSDFFVSKFDPNGNLQWSKQYGLSSKSTFGNSLTIDPNNGNILVVGKTNGSLYGSIVGSYDLFMSQINSNDGSVVAGKGKQMGAGGSITLANDIALGGPMQPGAIFLVGQTNGSFDGTSPTGSQGAFVTVIWQ